MGNTRGKQQINPTNADGMVSRKFEEKEIFNLYTGL